MYQPRRLNNTAVAGFLAGGGSSGLHRSEYTVVGAAVFQVAAAEPLAEDGQTVVSAEAWSLLQRQQQRRRERGDASCGEWLGQRIGGGGGAGEHWLVTGRRLGAPPAQPAKTRPPPLQQQQRQQQEEGKDEEGGEKEEDFAALVSHTFRRMDATSSGSVSYHLFLKWWKARAAEAGESGKLSDSLLQSSREAFLRHDVDQSGGLDETELSALLQELQLQRYLERPPLPSKPSRKPRPEEEAVPSPEPAAQLITTSHLSTAQANAAAAMLGTMVPGAIRYRLGELAPPAWQLASVSEFRYVTVLFARLKGVQFGSGGGRSAAAAAAVGDGGDGGGGAGDQLRAGVRALQRCVGLIQAALHEHEGAFMRFSVDDKGSVVLGVHGLPPRSHENDPERGVLTALSICRSIDQVRASWVSDAPWASATTPRV
jgi:hypothetical protein